MKENNANQEGGGAWDEGSLEPPIFKFFNNWATSKKSEISYGKYSDAPIDKRRYKIHLDFAAVKDFNVLIWIKAGLNDLGRTCKATE